MSTLIPLFHQNQQNHHESPNIHDEDDNGKTDIEDSGDEFDENGYDDGTAVAPGDIVWGLHGRIWHPAHVIHDSEVPINVASKLGKQSGKLIVKWWDGNYSSLPENKIELLGRNKIDEFRANRSAKIGKEYHLAVAELIDE